MGAECTGLGRRPAIEAGLAAVLLRILLLASSAGTVGSWIAFADHQLLPDIPGTSVSSELEIPRLGDSVNWCDVAATSLSNALIVCGTGQPCEHMCGLMWGSALRDANRVKGTACDSLERVANRQFGTVGGWGVDGVWSEADWALLQLKCFGNIGCPLSYCSPSPLSSALYPPEEQCSDFKITNGTYDLPFLTWFSMQHYERNNLGCSGGLDRLSEHDGEGYTTWHCVWSPECDHLAPNDMACFRYNHVRAEFIFWGWNSQLQLAPFIKQIDATFCQEDPDNLGSIRATILNAVLSEDRGVDRFAIVYVFSSIDPDTGRLTPYLRGSVRELADDGCAPIRLQSQTVYWLEMDAGPLYYDYRARFKTDETDMNIIAAVYPRLDQCDSLGITLQWCVGEGPDLDTYVFLPAEEGGDFVLNEAYMVSWANRQFDQYGASVDLQASITLQIDDWGGGEDGEPFTVGPESVYIQGRLMPGKYAVMSMIWTGNPDKVYEQGCATFTLYSGVRRYGRVVSKTVGQKGATANWWHAFNIVVDYDGVLPGQGEDWSTCTACGRRISYEVVDQMLPSGPPIDDDGNMPGNTGTWGGQPTEPYRRLYQALDEGVCLQYTHVGILIFDSVTGQPVPSATFKVDGSSVPVQYPQEGVLTNLGPEGFGGGYPMLQGSHTWLIEAEGYAAYSLEFTVAFQQETAYFAVYLIPADGVTRAVLRWGNYPQDLDIYVIPVGVVDADGVDVDWGSRSLEGVVTNPPATFGEGQSPYLWWGVNTDSGECQCLATTNPCKPSCTVVSIQGDVQISIDRDAMSHGKLDDINGYYTNNPETASLRNLLPGVYYIYANAYPPDGPVPTFAPATGEGEGDMFVDIWLGDGVEVAKVDTVYLPEGSGGKWFLAGYIDVTEAGPGECGGALQRLQKDSGRCYTWTRVVKVVISPLSLDYWPVQLFLKDAVVPGASFSLSSVKIFFAEETCTCLQACVCTGDEVYSAPFLGPAQTTSQQGWWGMQKRIQLANGDYKAVVGGSGYFDRVIDFRVANGRATLYAVMVPLVDAGGMRIVLTWDKRPYDLDLWAVEKRTPLPDYEYAVFWGQRTSDVASMGGVVLDRDATQSYGPETVSIVSTSPSKTMSIAVNVYNDATGNTPSNEGKCFAASPPYDYTGCHFFGGEKVEFYSSSRLEATSVYPSETSRDWWVVGTVVKAQDGSYTVNVADPLIASTCLSIFSDCPI